MATVIRRANDAATITPALVLGESATTTETESIVHKILASSDVIVALRPARAATGTLRLFFLDYAAAKAARAFHAAASVFLITTDSAPWLPAAYVPTDALTLTQQRENSRRWVLEVPYQEVTP